MKQFNELPVKIQKRMLDCQAEQGNEANSEVFMKNMSAMDYEGGFNWTETLEGFEAWEAAIINYNYTLLYVANPDLIP